MQNLLPGLILIDFVWCIRTSTGECLLLTQRLLRKLDTGMHRELLELFFPGCLRITQQQIDVVLVCETLQLRHGLKGINGKRTLRPRRRILQKTFTVAGILFQQCENLIHRRPFPYKLIIFLKLQFRQATLPGPFS